MLSVAVRGALNPVWGFSTESKVNMLIPLSYFSSVSSDHRLGSFLAAAKFKCVIRWGASVCVCVCGMDVCLCSPAPLQSRGMSSTIGGWAVCSVK